MSSEFICPLDVGMFGDIRQFLVRDCATVEEAEATLQGLGFIKQPEKPIQPVPTKPIIPVRQPDVAKKHITRDGKR